MRFKALILSIILLFLAGIARLEAATTTTTVALSTTTWTDLGPGPILLSGNGSMVYAVSDTAPSLTGGVGFPLPPNAAVTVNTTSHVWGLATNPYNVKAIVAPILASGTGAGSGVSKVMGNLGVPMLLPPQSTITTGGTLNLGTALSITYPSIYIYFQAAALYPASPAGWYYSVCATTTTCLVYNNIYAGGSTLIPATLNPITNGTAGTISSPLSSFVTAFTATIPGNSVGPNGYIQIMVRIGNNNSVNNKLFQSSWAGAIGLGSIVNTTNTQSFGIQGVHTLGVTNKIMSMGLGNYNFGSMSATPIIQTLDTTINQPMNFQLQLVNATDYIFIDSGVVELLPQGAN